MQFCVLLVTFGLAVTQASNNVSRAKGLQFIGVGYNLLKGNPEGGELSRGGVDPGLLLTRKIFKLTFNTNKVSVDGQISVPDQVVFEHCTSCVESEDRKCFVEPSLTKTNLKLMWKPVVSTSNICQID